MLDKFASLWFYCMSIISVIMALILPEGIEQLKFIVCAFGFIIVGNQLQCMVRT